MTSPRHRRSSSFGMFNALSEPLLSELNTPPSEGELAQFFGIDFQIKDHAPDVVCNNLMIAKVTMLILALPDGMLYLESAKKCAAIEFCAKPASFLPGKEEGWLVFSGGSGASISSGRGGFFAAPKIYFTFIEQNDLSKILLIFYCLIYIALQMSREIILALGSFDPDDNITAPENIITIIFPALAMISVGLYNAAETWPKVCDLVSKLITYVLDYYEVNSTNTIARRKHDEQNLQALKQLLNEKWQSILANPTLMTTHDSNSLRALMNTDCARQLHSYSSLHLLRLIFGYPFALTCSSILLTANGVNTYTQLGKIMPPGWQVFFTGLLALISTPAVTIMPARFFTSSDTLTWHFHPGLARASALLSTIWQTFSYASIFVQMNHMLTTDSNIHADTPGDRILESLAMIGIIAYHAEAILNILQSIIRTRTHSPVARYLFTLEENVRRLQNMTLQQYQRYINHMKPEQRHLLDITTYEEAKIEEDFSHTDDSYKPIAATFNQPQRSSFSQRWCPFLFGKKYEPDYEPDDDTHYVELTEIPIHSRIRK